MSNVFNYTEAELLSVTDARHPSITDFDEEPIPLKVYRYKVAHDIAVDVLLTQKKNWRSVYVRDVLLNRDGQQVAISAPSLIFNKEEAKRYLRTFNMVSKRKKLWVQNVRHNLKFYGNELGYL